MSSRPKPAREPRRLGELIDSLAGVPGWAERLALGRLRDHWSEVAGPAVAARSEPIRLARGELLVRAESSVWATELTLLGQVIADRARGVLGAEAIRGVRVIVGRGGATDFSPP